MPRNGCQLSELRLGDLVRVEWHDASKGEARVDRKKRPLLGFDIPVTSWGVFLGVLGTRVKHIVLLRDHFRMANGVFDIDFIVIPVGMMSSVHMLRHNELSPQMAELIQEAFLRARVRKRKGRVKIGLRRDLLRRVSDLPKWKRRIFWGDLESAIENRLKVLEHAQP